MSIIRTRRPRALLFGLAAATLALVLAGPRANASGQFSVGNPSLEHFDSDGGVQLDFGLTDQGGAPVGNLRADNVQVLEDGKAARIIDFRGAGQGRPVDIVFVLDVTESMQPYIDAVKQNVIAFAQDLAANNRDYRLGLVTFEDYVVSKYPDCNCAYQEKMTSNVSEFTGWVGSLHAGGGGDIPEDQLDALSYAASFPFRPEAQGVIILVTDAPPHHAGDGSAHTQHDSAFWDHHPDHNADVTDLTGDKVADQLKKNGLTLYAVVPPPFIAPEYAQIVDATHGRSYNIVTEEGRFSELVREIGHSIATEYSLTYRTPRPIEDGTEREVEVTVNYGGQTYTAKTSYQVRGVGGAAINVPEDSGTAGSNEEGSRDAPALVFMVERRRAAARAGRADRAVADAVWDLHRRAQSDYRCAESAHRAGCPPRRVRPRRRAPLRRRRTRRPAPRSRGPRAQSRQDRREARGWWQSIRSIRCRPSTACSRTKSRWGAARTTMWSSRMRASRARTRGCSGATAVFSLPT